MYFELIVVHTLFITTIKQAAIFYQSKRNCICQGLEILFYIHRVAELQNFCDEADAEYNKILQPDIMRFLS